MSSFYSPETYTVRGSIGYLIRRARNLMTIRVEREFETRQVTFVQWIVLMHLRDGLANTAAELSRDMCHDSGALARVVDQLEQRGLIERQRARDDRRVVELKLTPAGLATVNTLVPTVVGLLNGALAGFTDEEARTFTRLLSKFIDNVSAQTEPDAKELELVQ